MALVAWHMGSTIGSVCGGEEGKETRKKKEEEVFPAELNLAE